MKIYDVFLSYRRANGGEDRARNLKRELKSRGYSVFFDYESLSTGNYNDNIASAIRSCKYFIMLLSKGYFDRCSVADDAVAFEISTAVKADLVIIPLNYNCCFDYNEWPANLPPEIDAVKDLNAIDFMTGQLFDASIGNLIAKLEENGGPNEFLHYVRDAKTGGEVVGRFEDAHKPEFSTDEQMELILDFADMYDSFTKKEKKYISDCLNYYDNRVRSSRFSINCFEDAESCYRYFLTSRVSIYGTFEELPQNLFKWVTFENLEISLNFYKYFPEYFVPYLFNLRFERVKELLEYFHYELPSVPKRQRYKDRCLFYIEFCRAVYSIRTQMGWTPEEMCAFMYDYFEFRKDDSGELPEPSHVWFIGGKSVDTEKIAKSRFWQANALTKRGDIMIHYETSPKCAVNSIWRAYKDGVVDPFFFYYSYSYVGQKIEIPDIKADEFKSDFHFKNHPLVRKNFQGVNGWPVSFADYQRLLQIISDKGFDVSVLPKFRDPDAPVEISFEMMIEDSYNIDGIGYVLEGKVKQGAIKTSDKIDAIRDDGSSETYVVSAIVLGSDVHYDDTQAVAGNKVGIVIDGLNRRKSKGIVKIIVNS